MITKKIAILGGSTTSEIKDMIELFLLDEGIAPVFYESAYNRYYEEGFFANSELEKFCPDLIYIHTSFRNLVEMPEVTDTIEIVERKMEGTINKFRTLWDALKTRYNCPLIQNNFELPPYRLHGNRDCVAAQGRVNYVMRLNLMFSEYAAEHDFFHIHDIAYESADFGLEKWFDPAFWYMYKYAMCLAAIPYTAYGVFRIIKSIFGKNKKALVLDLDNTLWGGIIADDGVDRIEIGQETPCGQIFFDFQCYLKELKKMGVILTVDSKNDELIAKTGFDVVDSVLKEDDFAVFKANWNQKCENIIEIAKEMSLSLESFVFVDDSPVERENVRTGVPVVSVPELNNPEKYIYVLDRAGYFENITLSEEDLRRNEMYVANMRRIEIKGQYDNYNDFLKALDMKAQINHFRAESMGRIAQLTNKSNQFNLTTKRYSQSELEVIASSEDYLTMSGRLSDKFGDNGIVSVIIGKKIENELHIELWLMSCRVLKRNMEYAMLDKLVLWALEIGICEIYGYYCPTNKNRMVRDLYGQMGFAKVSEDENGNSKWILSDLENYNTLNTVIKIV